jgi:hypothetical protein
MPTVGQIKLIHTAVTLLDWSKPQYRMVLRGVAGVESCKLLDNRGVEDFMAIAEAAGFDDHALGKTYWRDRVAKRKDFANARMIHKIHALAADQRYDLASLCERFSEHRARLPEELHPHEAWNLIEMLKAVVAREAQSTGGTHGESTHQS